MNFASIRKLSTIFQVVRSMGLGWAFTRARGIISSRTNSLQRALPNAPWSDFDVELRLEQFRQRSIWPVSNSAASEFEALHQDPSLIKQLESLTQGHLALFGGKNRKLQWPPAWHRNADDDRELSAEHHFSKISTFGHGDIKNFWEPARFGFVWILCRAHFAGLTNQSGRLFFQAVTDFANQNPAFKGPQWMCGQEAALRAACIAAGWSVFRENASDSETRTVIQLLVATAMRIEVHLDYALSQKNNHGLSEAMGLLLVGLALPEHPDSKRWETLGRLTLEREASRLVDSDGGFSQQSANYHRVMVHVLVIAVSVARNHGIELLECIAALKRSSQFVASMLVSRGRQPRYGHDDGACVLDWTGCDYDDFRPALQESCYASGLPLMSEPGKWDVGLAWLGAKGPSELNRLRPEQNSLVVHRKAGVAILRDETNFASIRVPPAVYRPGQVDAMHVDVWLDGQPIALDPGTYRYNATGRWSTIPLALGRYHNVVTSGESDLAKRVGRFLYVPWPKATVETLTRHRNDQTNSVKARFEKSIGKIKRWERQLSIDATSVVVVDSVRCNTECPVQLQWQLVDGEIESVGQFDRQVTGRSGHWMHWRTSAGLTELCITIDQTSIKMHPVHQRASDSAAGWYAPRYGELAPCHTVTTEFESGEATELTIQSRFRTISDSNETQSKETP